MERFTIGARVAQVFYGERQIGTIDAMRRPDASAVFVRFDNGRGRMAFVAGLELIEEGARHG